MDPHVSVSMSAKSALPDHICPWRPERALDLSLFTSLYVIVSVAIVLLFVMEEK